MQRQDVFVALSDVAEFVGLQVDVFCHALGQDVFSHEEQQHVLHLIAAYGFLVVGIFIAVFPQLVGEDGYFVVPFLQDGSFSRFEFPFVGETFPSHLFLDAPYLLGCFLLKAFFVFSFSSVISGVWRLAGVGLLVVILHFRNRVVFLDKLGNRGVIVPLGTDGHGLIFVISFEVVSVEYLRGIAGSLEVGGNEVGDVEPLGIPVFKQR